MDKVKKILLRLIPTVLTVVMLTFYFPLFNVRGLRLADGFYRYDDSEKSLTMGSVQILDKADGVIFDGYFGELAPLLVEREGERFTILREGEILYQGKAPDPAYDRYIQPDGLLVAGNEAPKGNYPLTVSQLIGFVTGEVPIRGQSNFFTLGLAALVIWCADVLFPNLFYRLDFRHLGKKGEPPANWRKVQRVLQIILPLWGVMSLVMALM